VAIRQVEVVKRVVVEVDEVSELCRYGMHMVVKVFEVAEW
jgi:hypothetical protein